MLTPYTPDEVELLFDNVNCIHDIQHLSDYLTEFSHCYDTYCWLNWQRNLKLMVKLWEPPTKEMI